jgi:hypothetical protein
MTNVYGKIFLSANTDWERYYLYEGTHDGTVAILQFKDSLT